MAAETYRRLAREEAERIAPTLGVSADDLLGFTRSPMMVRIRREFWMHLRKEKRLSYSEIAMAVGRDHSTIIRGLR